MELSAILQIIEHHRKRKGITKQRLCEQSQLTPQYYDLLLKNRSNATYDVVRRLARNFDLDFRIFGKTPVKIRDVNKSGSEV